MSCTLIVAAGMLLTSAVAGDGPAPIEPVPFAVPARLPDRAEVLAPSQVHVGGWLGARIDANEKNRLLQVDTEPLLAGYRKSPGSASLDRRARRQVAARRDPGLGLHGRRRRSRRSSTGSPPT